MKIGYLLIGFMLISLFVVFVIDDKYSEQELTNCYDSKANVILGQTCLKQTYGEYTQLHMSLILIIIINGFMLLYIAFEGKEVF